MMQRRKVYIIIRECSGNPIDSAYLDEEHAKRVLEKLRNPSNWGSPVPSMWIEEVDLYV